MASARAQLLAVSLLSLEKQAQGLPADFIRSDPAHSRALGLGFIGVCAGH